MKGPDHKASLEPKDFKFMVDKIRNIEKALGNGKKIKGESFGFIATDVRKGTKTNQKKGRGKSTSSGTGNKSTGAKEGSAENTGLRQRTNRGRTGGVDWQAQVQRFQNASPEERQSMIEQFRQMRGGRGRRSRRN